ncbi:MAG: hypothetical protein JWQ71_5017 [Pedosphaera sp.]|nr:hypothetical protein [Pedosphaera sp.]
MGRDAEREPDGQGDETATARNGIDESRDEAGQEQDRESPRRNKSGHGQVGHVGDEANVSGGLGQAGLQCCGTGRQECRLRGMGQVSRALTRRSHKDKNAALIERRYRNYLFADSGGEGRVKKNVAPWSMMLSAQMWPPWRVMMRWTVARPTPWPGKSELE